MAEEENQELNEETLKERETVIMDIGKKFRDDGKAVELENMIKMIRPFTKLLSKAKAAKLIRGLVDMYLDMETGASKGRAEQAVELCKECIQWATEEKRSQHCLQQPFRSDFPVPVAPVMPIHRLTCLWRVALHLLCHQLVLT
mgnify:CR=1 FL=1